MAAKFDLTGTAMRLIGTIDATVYAVLPDGCHRARITDIYPGGNIRYVVDPGVAQVFVRFTRHRGPCTQVIRPWSDSRQIPDSYHEELEIIGEFEGETFSVRVPIHDFKLAKGSGIDPGFSPGAADFIVIALVSQADGGHVGCRIVHKDALYPAIYRPVFGPATHAECEAFKAENCLRIEPGDVEGEGAAEA